MMEAVKNAYKLLRENLIYLSYILKTRVFSHMTPCSFVNTNVSEESDVFIFKVVYGDDRFETFRIKKTKVISCLSTLLP